MADFALGLQGLGVLHHGAVLDGLPVGQGVHIVDHAHVDEVRAQTLQQIPKPGAHLVHVPGALVLAVLPDGAQMALEQEFVPPPLQRAAQAGAHPGVRGVQVDVVDPQALGGVQQGLHQRAAVVHEALAAHADLAHPQAGAAQLSFFHGCHLFRLVA